MTTQPAYALAADTLRVALVRQWGMASFCRDCRATARKSADALLERHWRALDRPTEETFRAAVCAACGSRRLHLYWIGGAGRMTGHGTLTDLAAREAALDAIVADRLSETAPRSATRLGFGASS